MLIAAQFKTFATKANVALLILMFLDRILFSQFVASTKMFKNVCLGGTFDGIHAGHKVLFNEATKICSERLVVGVTDRDMIKNKVTWELIAPIETRMQEVKRYLTGVNPNLTYEIVAINDIYGPTIEDESLECIVVSEETVKGAHKINDIRKGKGWPALDIRIVNLVQDNSTSDAAMSRLNERKVSSSLMRLEKLGTLIRAPEMNKSIPDRPYLIGLTGGIASGKTTVGKYLESLGFGYINYDLLGHKTYAEINSPTYKQIVETFGNSILDEATQLIARSKLGKMVFANKTKLNQLNDIVWPAIYELVDREIEQLKDKHDIIVLESALLIESNQTKRVHEIWTTIVSPDEAVKRQVQSRGLSEEEAKERVNSQIDNLTRVQQSNVVFCSAWEVEFTRQQVDKCVKELRKRLSSTV